MKNRDLTNTQIASRLDGLTDRVQDFLHKGPGLSLAEYRELRDAIRVAADRLHDLDMEND